MENNRSYENFDASFKWRSEETERVLEINLPGFKKENLRIQINSSGILTVSGERPADETKWIRFRNVFNVPRDCKLDTIRAKFSNEVLYVKMKKKVSSRTRRHDQDRVSGQEGYSANESAEAAATTGNAIFSMVRATKCLSGVKTSLRLKMSRNVARRLGALVGVVLAVTIGTFVAYKFRQSFHFDD